MLFARGLCEIAAAVASADGNVTPNRREVCKASVAQIAPFSDKAVAYLDIYFFQCCNGQSEDLFKGCIANLKPEALAMSFVVARRVATADGDMNPKTEAALRVLAKRIGLDPSYARVEEKSPEPNAVVEGWWTVLKINKGSSADDIRAAYRKLAAQLHPDTLANAPEELKRAAEDRFKVINGAYEQALKDARS